MYISVPWNVAVHLDGGLPTASDDRCITCQFNRPGQTQGTGFPYFKLELPVGIMNSLFVWFPPETYWCISSEGCRKAHAWKLRCFGEFNLMSFHVGAVEYRTTTRRPAQSFLITTRLLFHITLSTSWFGSSRGTVRSVEGNFDKGKLASERSTRLQMCSSSFDSWNNIAPRKEGPFTSRGVRLEWRWYMKLWENHNIKPARRGFRFFFKGRIFEREWLLR